jgi:YVTN family beta-propeller protein
LSGLSDRRAVAGWVAIALLGAACGTGQHRASVAVRSVVALPSKTTLPFASSAQPSQAFSSTATSTPASSPTSTESVPPTPQTHPMTSFPPPPSAALMASVVKQVALPGSGADAIAIDSDVAYVVDGGAASAVLMLDLTTDVVSKSIAVGAAPVAVAVDPTLHTAYVVNGGTGSVSVIDKASASVVATVPVGAKPVAIAVDPTRHLAYVANNAGNSISIIDEKTNTVTDTLQVGQGPVAVAVDTATNTIFVANTNGGQGSISRINGATHVVTPTQAPGPDPLGLTLDAAGNTLYVDTFVASPATNAGVILWLMDEKTLFTWGTARLTFDGAGTPAFVVDSEAHTLYALTRPSVAGADGELLVLPSPDTFLGQAPFVPVGIAPRAVALNPATHDLYVVNGDNTITLVAGIGSAPSG